MSKKIMAVILAYNCQNEINKTLRKIRKFEKYFYKICIIDNNSKDRTFANASIFIKNNNLKKYEIIKNLKNFGQGGSHKVAFEYTLKNKCDYCLVYHGDDQANIKDFKKIFTKKSYYKYDAILGARFLKNSKLINYQMYRILGNKIFNFLFSFVSNYKIYDLGSGINLYGKKVISDKYVKFIDNEMGFNYQNLLLMIKKKRSLKFTPISWKTEDEESNVQLVSQSLKVLKIVLLFFFKNDYFRYLEKTNFCNEKPTSKIFNFNKERKISWKFRL
tara:strand:- start:2492 stop:3313 length:822 start_codon:yes stop_codon:yes gene_type:complete